ncbi:MAG: ATP-binding protein [Nitrospirota bacterium]
MKDLVKINIPSHPKYLSLVRDVTVWMGRLNGLDEGITDNLKLAVDEACSNVIKHAYRGNTSGNIVVKYKITKKNFKVVLEDSGIKTDVESLKGRSLEDIRPGGLGIHFIKRVFDTFELDEKKKTGNRLILIKNLK